MSVCDFVSAINSVRTAYLLFLICSMPIRAIVSPKFTYGQNWGVIRLRRTESTTDAWKNGMFDYSELESTDALTNYIFLPTIAYPAIGNGHSTRKSNRITVSSVRVKMHFVLRYDMLTRFSFLSVAMTGLDKNTNLPLNPTMFMKFRLFLISVDDDIEVTPAKLLNWFYATHCLYKPPIAAEVLKGPKDADVTTSPGPTSVHSNVLRVTTDWTGKFNVLADRKFSISPRHPCFDIDMTIPLKKEFVFDEDYSANSKLLYPKLYLFILPPLSYEVDVDPATYDYCKHQNLANKQVLSIFDTYCWSKLNFVDL